MSCRDSELMVLAGIFAENSAFDVVGLEPEDFEDRRNRSIYSALGRMINQGLEANLLTVTHELRESGELTSVGIGYLGEIDPVTAANIEYYAGEVRKESRKRKLKRWAQRVLESADKADPNELLDEAETGLSLISTGKAQGFRKIGDVVHSAIDEIESLDPGLG